MAFSQLIPNSNTKKQIREEILTKRRLYPQLRKEHDDIIITRTLESLDIINKSKSIFSYISLPDEVSTIPFIRKILTKGKCVLVVPKVKKENLEFYHIFDFKHLKESAFGILEPVSCQQVPVTYPDLFITAGIAFDSKGSRIGFGKGYMDWTFNQTQAPKIALAYDFQVLETVPYEVYDRQVDLIVTPTRIINCTKRINF